MIDLPVDYTEFNKKYYIEENKEEVPIEKVFENPTEYISKVAQLLAVLVALKHIDGPVFKTPEAPKTTMLELVEWTKQRMDDTTVSKYRLLLINQMYKDYIKVISI